MTVKAGPAYPQDSIDEYIDYLKNESIYSHSCNWCQIQIRGN